MKRIDAERNTSFVGNGQLGTIQSARMTIGDTVHPIISIGSEIGGFAGEDPRKRISKQTITIDADGSSSKLLITLKRYVVDQTNAAVASGVTVTIDGIDYTTGSGGIISHTIAGASYNTLHDVLAAINALPGFIAFIGDALTTHNTNTNDFIDLAETVVPEGVNGLLNTLYRDVSEDDIAYLRIGLPRKYDMAPIQVVGLSGLITSATGAAGYLIVDNDSEYMSDASHQETVFQFTPATSLTDHIADNVLEAADYRGSLVLKVSATNATGSNYLLKYRQVLGVHRNM